MRQNPAACTARVASCSAPAHVQRGQGGLDRVGRDGGVRHRPGNRAIGFRETVQAAHPAPRRPEETSTSRRERIGRFSCQPQAQVDAVIDRNDIEFGDVRRRRHDAFGQTEADREIGQVGGSGHHHRVGGAVIGERDGRFLGQRALARVDGATGPGVAGELG